MSPIQLQKSFLYKYNVSVAKVPVVAQMTMNAAGCGFEFFYVYKNAI